MANSPDPSVVGRELMALELSFMEFGMRPDVRHAPACRRSLMAWRRSGKTLRWSRACETPTLDPSRTAPFSRDSAARGVSERASAAPHSTALCSAYRRCATALYAKGWRKMAGLPLLLWEVSHRGEHARTHGIAHRRHDAHPCSERQAATGGRGTASATCHDDQHADRVRPLARTVRPSLPSRQPERRRFADPLAVCCSWALVVVVVVVVRLRSAPASSRQTARSLLAICPDCTVARRILELNPRERPERVPRRRQRPPHNPSLMARACGCRICLPSVRGQRRSSCGSSSRRGDARAHRPMYASRGSPNKGPCTD
jgi:hypothetical protein